MKFFGTASFIALTFGSTLLAQDAPDQRDSLTEVVRDWIQISKQIEETENTWEEDRRLLEAYRDNLKSQIQAYQTDIEAEQPYLEQREKILEEKNQDQANYEAAREAFAKRLPELEDKALKVAKLFPPILLQNDTIKQGVDLLTAEVGSRSKADYKAEDNMNSRLVSVLNILREAEKFQNKITVVKEADDQAAFDTIYFGLGQAYRAERTGEKAWIGRLVDGKFAFIPANDHAAAIRELILIGDEAQDAGMTAIPTLVK